MWTLFMYNMNLLHLQASKNNTFPQEIFSINTVSKNFLSSPPFHYILME